MEATSCFTGPTATGTGDATLCIVNDIPCGFNEVRYIAVEGDQGSPPVGTAPAGVVFPHGLFTFTIEGCAPGFEAELTWTVPTALPPGTELWKFGPTAADPTPHWYTLPSTSSGNVISFAVTDGGAGDNDLAANGRIEDPAGPGAAVRAAIPTLSQIGLFLLTVLLVVGGLVVLRRS
jgi:hypothetical protein